MKLIVSESGVLMPEIECEFVKLAMADAVGFTLAKPAQ